MFGSRTATAIGFTWTLFGFRLMFCWKDIPRRSLETGGGGGDDEGMKES